MNTIITPEIITDIQDLNPGCIIPALFGFVSNGDKTFEYNRLPKSDLKFKTIPSFGNIYEINENGTVIRNVKTKRNLTIFLDTHHSKLGYYATFINFKGVVRRLMIHVAVAEAWIGSRPEGLEVDHIDRNPHNNDYHNLRYVTHSEQMKNRILSNRIIEQCKSNCRKYLVEKVMKPVKLVAPDGSVLEFESYVSCARYLSDIFHEKIEHIRKCVLGKGDKEYNGYKIFYVVECVKQIEI